MSKSKYEKMYEILKNKSSRTEEPTLMYKAEYVLWLEKKLQIKETFSVKDKSKVKGEL